MQILDFATSAGEGDCNEDRCGQAGDLAWIIDGATSFGKFPTLPSCSDAEWVAIHVDNYLRTRSRTLSEPDIPSLFGDLASDIGEKLEDLRYPTERVPPVCSCGIAWYSDGLLRMGIVGDVSIYEPKSGVLLEDPLFARREAAAVRAQSESDPKKLSLLESSQASIEARRRQYISGSVGSFVLTNNPQVAGGVRQIEVSFKEPTTLLLCTDGFARLVKPYGIYTWRSLTEAVSSSGVAGAMKTLREHEKTMKKGNHFKRSDDACALLVSLD